MRTSGQHQRQRLGRAAQSLKMPTTITRQRTTSRSSSKRPESPIKRSSSARLNHSARSPSPFSLNTSHNEMPTAISLDADSNVILKPAQPIRRRSNRLSAAINKAANGSLNGAGKTSSVKSDVSSNGHGIKTNDSISELHESPAKSSQVDDSPAAPLGHGTTTHENTFTFAISDAEINGTSLPAPLSAISIPQPPKAAPPLTAKPKTDWEIPRKALHSSIGKFLPQRK